MTDPNPMQSSPPRVHHRRPPSSTPILPRYTHSTSDGSQQERNRASRIPRDASSRTAPRPILPHTAPDVSSLTHKDHASTGGRIAPTQPPKLAVIEPDFVKKHADARTELLEENRMLRIELEHVKYKLRKSESICRKHRKSAVRRDRLLEKYRSQLVGLFESGNNEFLQRKDRTPSCKQHDDSFSDDDDWSSYTIRSGSADNDEWPRNSEYAARKKGRTRAPAWTQEEEQIFMQAYEKHGCQWKLFQDSLPGRSRRQIQSHGSYLIRQGKLLKKNSRPWQRRKPRETQGNRSDGEGATLLVGAPSQSMRTERDMAERDANR